MTVSNFNTDQIESAYNLESADRPLLRRNKSGVIVVGGAAVTASIATIAGEQPSEAAGVEDITAMITSLGGIAAAALVVALVPFGIVYAMRIVRRVMN